MADSSILLDNGQRLDTESFTRGAQTIERQRGLLLQAVNPQIDVLSQSVLAAGASTDLDGSFIASGSSGFLVVVVASSSAACKWEIKTVDGLTENTLAVIFTSGLSGDKPTSEYRPGGEFHKLEYGDGDELFRVTVTNLDARNAAAVYATLYWDET